MDLSPNLSPDDKEILKCFIKTDKPEGVILLDIKNPLPFLVAFRIGWFMENSLEYYTPWTPITPDYLKAIAAYLAWTGVFRNVMIKCQIKAIDPDIKDVIYNSIHEIFTKFACKGNVREGTISSDGLCKMEDKGFFTTENVVPPKINVEFECGTREELNPTEEDLLQSLDEAFRYILREEKE
jgi:hypothetical protein